jgi:DNA-binding protein YbaB
MKKILINEDWEAIEVEDTSSFFALIFKQGTSVAGYIKKYSVDDTLILAEYEALISKYEGVKFIDPASIMVVKLPATGQVKAMLEEATYNGDETNPTKIEIINHLLERADCEIIKERVLMSLEEAKKKKKKKKKKTPKVTYTTGWPWYNDHMFNHHMGSCDCSKDKDGVGEDAADNANDAIGGGESAGDAGSAGGDFGGDFGGDAGGAMGEGLVNEALTPLEKMQALESGTRGFNAAAAGDAKLASNLSICTNNGLSKAAKIMADEIQARINAGIWTLSPNILGGAAPTTTQSPSPVVTPAAPTQPATPLIDLATFNFWSIGKHYVDSTDAGILKYYVETNDLNRLIELLEDNLQSTPAEIKLSYSLAMLLFAMYFKYEAAVKAISASIIKIFGCTAVELKDYIKNKILNNSVITSRVRAAVESALTEQVEKGAQMNLTEAKRYIKRYYIRPQNVFASNKAEILQRLAEVEGEGANCSVYSLKALEDHDDVHLLQPKDIIYYYDDGILYDKNHVPVLDYDLNVKNEEERPRISPEATSDERFKAVYQDRMTDRTIAESLEEEFFMDFDDVNAYGIKLHEGKEAEYTCCICGDDFEGYGNNPAPYKESGKCCDACNRKFVIPARLAASQEGED